MKAFLLLLFIIVISSCKTDNQFVITGAIDGDYANEWIYLNEFMEPEPQVDSALVKNGKFTFRGTIKYPEVFILHNKSESDFKHFAFMLEPAKINIEISHDDWAWGCEIMGGPVNDEYNKEYNRCYRNKGEIDCCDPYT